MLVDSSICEKGASFSAVDPWPIFVISLADAHERRRRISEQCADLELEIEILDAIDGRARLPAEFEVEIDRSAAEIRQRRRLSDAEFACALSHRSVYQRIVEDDLPGAVLLEDDAVLSPQFANFIRNGGYREADFIQMDYWPARVVWRQRRNWSAEIKLVPMAENTTCAVGYSVSAKGARYILSKSTPLAGLADWPCDMMPLDPLVTFPRIVTHLPPGSDDSFINSERDALFENREPAASRGSRFFRRDYWRRWWMKRRTRRIS